MKKSLLTPYTKIIFITHLPPNDLTDNEYLHHLSSTFDALIISLADPRTISGRIYTYLPYISPDEGRILLATLSPAYGMKLVSTLQPFPDKYTKFLKTPTIKIATEMIDERQNKQFCNRRLIKYFEQGMNFKCAGVQAEDNLYGTKNSDGSWSGIIGLLVRKEADFSAASFAYMPSRADVVDYTIPLLVQYSIIIGKLGQPELDPWSFHLPLDIYVWLSIAVTLLVFPGFLSFLSYGSSRLKTAARSSWSNNFFQLIRILMQQDIFILTESLPVRVVMGAWMLMALVLIRSYASNLMSVLAVRYIHQPYQSLSNVLENPDVTMIWQTNSSRVQYFRAAKSGIFRQVAEREKADGIKFLLLHQFPAAMDTLLRKGHHVLVTVEIMARILIGNDFTKRGRCDFYNGRERILPEFLFMLGQKGSPIVPQINKRIMSSQESGLYDQFIKYSIPNVTACIKIPTRITNSSSLSFSHIWLLVDGSGGVVALLAAVGE
ncbi:glutamate receptor ionotropic, delta-2-like [Eriocheir sinensis]|uniref:glutamate receptor ionotropic, delta-2-like n=1 Tax=Eriocheir sinensis TaxID=95602 RepID=UPI0021C75389|nr:glutamate receptor ionotropic, delta-2-like [Eriocheir sinensis]